MTPTCPLLRVCLFRVRSHGVSVNAAPALPFAVPRGRNECYRIHFEVNYVGKMIKAAKRKVTWKFVFAGDKGELHRVAICVASRE